MYVKTMADDTLLTVKGLPKDERIRLAAFDSYNGMVINVDPAAGGSFAPVGDASDIRSADTGQDRTSAELEISIQDYDGVWVPSGGKLMGLELTGGREDATGPLPVLQRYLRKRLELDWIGQGECLHGQGELPSKAKR